jgi:hypothetical protein
MGLEVRGAMINPSAEGHPKAYDDLNIYRHKDHHIRVSPTVLHTWYCPSLRLTHNLKLEQHAGRDRRLNFERIRNSVAAEDEEEDWNLATRTLAYCITYSTKDGVVEQRSWNCRAEDLQDDRQDHRVAGPADDAMDPLLMEQCEPLKTRGDITKVSSRTVKRNF